MWIPLGMSPSPKTVTTQLKKFISVLDAGNIDALVEKALAYKKAPLKDKSLGTNKRIGLLFLNPSMRTRLSTQIASQNLGMEPIVFNIASEGWALEFEEEAIMSGNTVEHVKDAAPVMGKYFDILNGNGPVSDTLSAASTGGFYDGANYVGSGSGYLIIEASVDTCDTTSRRTSRNACDGIAITTTWARDSASSRSWVPRSDGGSGTPGR